MKSVDKEPTPTLCDMTEIKSSSLPWKSINWNSAALSSSGHPASARVCVATYFIVIVGAKIHRWPVGFDICQIMATKYPQETYFSNQQAITWEYMVGGGGVEVWNTKHIFFGFLVKQAISPGKVPVLV